MLTGIKTNATIRAERLVTKFGDLFGCLVFLDCIEVISHGENGANYSEYTAKIVQNRHFRYLANPT